MKQILNIYAAPRCEIISFREPLMICASPTPEVEFGRDTEDTLDW